MYRLFRGGGWRVATDLGSYAPPRKPLEFPARMWYSARTRFYALPIRASHTICRVSTSCSYRISSAITAVACTGVPPGFFLGNTSRVRPNTILMARLSLKIRAERDPKFKSRVIRRCHKCGRRHGYLRDFDLCRICFRGEALKGHLPGIKKSSW